MSSCFTIAVDVMGGDHGLPVTIPAVLNTIKAYPDIHFILVGQSEAIHAFLKQAGVSVLPESLEVCAASQVVDMDELPSMALKHKKDSSMRLAINLVKEGRAHACVSAGNTGALMATAKFVLKTLPNIERPAIITAFPTVIPQKVSRVLDLGANIDSSPANLLQFAVMGSVLASAVDNIDKPSVGLLNVGQEEMKGNDQVKEASRLLQQHTGLNYIGYVEGNDIYSGQVDVIVCDGFVGNIALKSSEGIAQLILHYLKQSFKQNLYTRCIALLAMPILRLLKKRVDPANYNGACLIGLRGIVIKSHGGANVSAFMNAIAEAIKQAKQNIPFLVQQEVERLLTEPPAHP